MQSRICVVVGTRPEIIKMASIIHELRDRSFDFVLLHAGQHYDNNMSQIFFDELDLPRPDLNLETGSGSQAEQTATALVRLESAFRKFSPQVVLVEGDTNTVLAGALAAAKLGVTVGHVEAGLRCYDRQMPEEHNRTLTDHLSSYLFAPTARAAKNLREESCWGTIEVTGNTIIDACVKYAPVAERRSKILSQIPFVRFVLATAHRAENVDDPSLLREFLRIFEGCPLPVVYPIHPRTRQMFNAAGLGPDLENCANVKLLPPLGYFDFLTLLRHCDFVLTDSGGIQEEVTAPNIKKRAFVLRKSTERPEAVEAGYVEIVGTRADVVLKRVNMAFREEWLPSSSCPFGDGLSGRHIVDSIEKQVLGSVN